MENRILNQEYFGEIIEIKREMSNLECKGLIATFLELVKDYEEEMFGEIQTTYEILDSETYYVNRTLNFANGSWYVYGLNVSYLTILDECEIPVAYDSEQDIYIRLD
ncbi:TPA: hypothetical protein KRE82_003607 [Clostridioides difficile]|nr:hypothetical protein [Clostridioides difficile]